MRQLKRKVEMLAWANRYREIERQSAEFEAGAKAIMLRQAEEALAAASDERDNAAMRWMTTAECGGALDLIIGELWKAEYYRCDRVQQEGCKTRDDAQAELEIALRAFQQKAVLSERSQNDLNAAKRKSANKLEEQRLLEAADFFTLKAIKR